MKIERPKENQPIPSHAERVFKGIIFDVYQWEQELYDGTKATFEKLRRMDSAKVFPVLSDGRILLLEQSQPGKEPYVGGVGGRMEEGEEALDAVKRELLEETGYEASEFILLQAAHTTAKTDYVVYYFIAKGCKKVTEQSLDSGERISLLPVTFDEFLQMARSKHFIDKDMVPLLYEALLVPAKKEELKKAFGL